MQKRTTLHALLAGLLLAASVSAVAQDRPVIKLLVGFPPGGASDSLARLLADELDRLAALAEHNHLLAVALDIDHLVDADRTILALFPFFGFDRRGIGQFIMQAQIDLLAGDLGGQPDQRDGNGRISKLGLDGKEKRRFKATVEGLSPADIIATPQGRVYASMAKNGMVAGVYELDLAAAKWNLRANRVDGFAGLYGHDGESLIYRSGCCTYGWLSLAER